MVKFIPNLKLTPVGTTHISSKDNQPYILNLATGEYLMIQGMPQDLNYNPEMQVATISSIGRNNSLYQHGGGEDILKFVISYYSQDEELEDVIKSCKWVESLTKNDGFQKGHPILHIGWGKLYSKAQWILISAPYVLRNFDRAKGLLPKLASQELTFKRVTPGNLTHKEILSLDL